MPIIEFNMYNSIGNIENNNQKYSIEYRLVINNEKTIEYKSEYDKNYVDGLVDPHYDPTIHSPEVILEMITGYEWNGKLGDELVMEKLIYLIEAEKKDIFNAEVREYGYPDIIDPETECPVDEEPRIATYDDEFPDGIPPDR